MAQQQARSRTDDIADVLSGRVYNTLRLLLKRTAGIGPLRERLKRVMSQQKQLEEQLNVNLGRISQAIGSIGERLRNQEGRLREMQERIDTGGGFSSADLAGEVEQTAALAEQLENLARVADPTDPTTIDTSGILVGGNEKPAPTGVILSEDEKPGAGGGPKVAPEVTAALKGGASGRDRVTGMPQAADATLIQTGGQGQAPDAGEAAGGPAGSAPSAAGGDPAAD